MSIERRRALFAAVVAITVGLASACAAEPPKSSSEDQLPIVSPTPAATPVPTPSPECTGPEPSPDPDSRLVNVHLTGDGPIDIELEEGTSIAWVIASDSGDLIGVDLTQGCEVATYAAGSLLTTLALSEGEAYVGQLSPEAGDQPLRAVDLTDGRIEDIVSNEIGGINVLDDYVLALEKTGVLRAVSIADRQTLDTLALEVDSNEHMEIVSDGIDAWLSSDSTFVRRVSLQEAGSGDQVSAALSLDASIHTLGGIPFDVDGGLIWGARPDELWAIDPTTNELVEHVQLEDMIEILAVDVEDGQAWIAGRAPGRVGTVVRVDVGTEEVLGQWPVSLPASVKVFGDHAWVASFETDELIGIPLGQ
jgi:hypothetical protein